MFKFILLHLFKSTLNAVIEKAYHVTLRRIALEKGRVAKGGIK